MLHLRRCILARILSSPSASPISPLHRLLSAAAPAVSPNPGFAAEEYLVGTCGLTPAQALKASAKLSRVNSPTNPNAVLAFLAGLGLSRADVAALVAKDPKFLRAGVVRTLSPSEVASLVSLAPVSFRRRSIVSKLRYYLHLFGSYDRLLRVLNRPPDNTLLSKFESVVKPNVVFLMECGLGVCDIANLCIIVPRLLSSRKGLQGMVACAEGLGVPRGSWMFRHVLHAVGFHGEKNIAAKVDNLKKMFRWSNAEVRIAVSMNPSVLSRSKETLQHMSEFLTNEVGLERAYIARRPNMLSFSLEGRLKPRYYVLKFLRENGLQDCEPDYFSTFALSEKVFVEKFIYRHKEAASHLAEEYGSTCRGEGSTNFRCT